MEPQEHKLASRLAPLRPYLRRVNWWLLLVGPLSAGLVVLDARFDPDFETLDTRLEAISPGLLVVPLALYAIGAVRTRNPLFTVLAALAFSLLCREIHFRGMDRAIYPMLAVVGFWALLWRKRLVEPLTADWRHTTWLIATAGAYVFALLMDRRVFKPIPGENPIHSKLEEGAETMAHVVFIITSALARWRRARPPAGREPQR
jgi:hypothetical protein